MFTRIVIKSFLIYVFFFFHFPLHRHRLVASIKNVFQIKEIHFVFEDTKIFVITSILRKQAHAVECINEN